MYIQVTITADAGRRITFDRHLTAPSMIVEHEGGVTVYGELTKIDFSPEDISLLEDVADYLEGKAQDAADP